MVTTLDRLFWDSASRYAQRPALVCDGDHITYEKLGRLVAGAAQGLRRLGLGKDSRVVLMLGNGVPYIVYYYAALSVGSTVVPINPMLTAAEVDHVLTDCDAALLISDNSSARFARGASDRATTSYLNASTDLVGAESAATESSVRTSPSDQAVILYTSGTTGTPKGAVLTHANMVANAWVSASHTMFGLTDQDVVLACLPLFHAYAQTCVLNASILSGSCVVVVPKFVASAVVDTMLAEEVTVFEGVPTMFVGLLEAARESLHQLPKLRIAASGGAALAVAVLEQFEAVFGCPIYEGYGLSETSPMACFNQPQFERRPGTVGKPIWGVEVEIADATQPESVVILPIETPGEVVIRGHNVFAGYLGNADATDAAIVDGWFRTGDIGIKDGDGYLRLIDRMKDLIVRGGYNVYPREVEELLMKHPGVAEVAVVGRHDDVFGEEIVAAIRLSDTSASFTLAELTEWLRDRLARYKHPRELVFVDRLPVGSTGKILKREVLSTIAAQGSSTQPPATRDTAGLEQVSAHHSHQ
ncbi:MAG: long-chain-fatty-acid--CoA ligase [Rhodococcus sp. (in: high G+C Gram-positive bacteria)]